MSTKLHLVLQELTVPPSDEWRLDDDGWMVARVAGGIGYCLHDNSVKELKTGEVIIAGPNANGSLRASQLGELRLEYFFVVPQQLNDLITVVEWHQLEQISKQPMPRIFHLAASDMFAKKLARLAALSQRDNLVIRSALLQLWATYVTRLISTPGEHNNGKTKLRDRFRLFFGKMSEKELATASLADMAARLNCSERHLGRLFRATFGVPLRTHQTELRLNRAHQLLSSSDAKISSVANESGYRHIGLFNAMFKKRFGLTPGEWRQQNSSRAQPPMPSRTISTWVPKKETEAPSPQKN